MLAKVNAVFFDADLGVWTRVTDPDREGSTVGVDQTVKAGAATTQ
jgi:hypothetical protein